MNIILNEFDNNLILFLLGTVYVNCYDVFDCNAPFGGFKSSGLGRYRILKLNFILF